MGILSTSELVPAYILHYRYTFEYEIENTKVFHRDFFGGQRNNCTNTMYSTVSERLKGGFLAGSLIYSAMLLSTWTTPCLLAPSGALIAIPTYY